MLIMLAMGLGRASLRVTRVIVMVLVAIPKEVRDLMDYIVICKGH
jgi:hypothetical protein